MSGAQGQPPGRSSLHLGERRELAHRASSSRQPTSGQFQVGSAIPACLQPLWKVPGRPITV